MSNDERQEKRVQAALKVRYKSATVTEFIEKHSHDISPGGVFIRSQKPLDKGSLLKIDFRLEDDTAVIQGVGRVVWTRGPSDDSSKPSGMGIKFIRLDENSKVNIRKIISMQKSGEEITRASILGDEDEENDSSSAEQATQDSAAPLADEKMGGDEKRSLSDGGAVDSEEEPTQKIDVAKKSKADKGDTGRTTNKTAGEKSSRKPRESASGAPAKEKKNVGIIVVLLLIVAATVGFYLMQPAEEGVDDEKPPQEMDAKAADAASNVPVETQDPGAEEPVAAPEPDPPPAALVSGEVKIATDVEGATVSIDGTQRGVTPLTIPSVEVGEHDLLVTLFGYQPLEQIIVAEEGVPVELDLKLEQARFMMQLKSNVVGAKVFIGEKQIGRTPYKSVQRRDANFEYVVMKPNYQDFSGKVTESDWTYEDGAYVLQIEATMVEEVVSAKVVAPVQESKPQKRVVRPKPKATTPVDVEAEAKPEAKLEAKLEAKIEAAAPDEAKQEIVEDKPVEKATSEPAAEVKDDDAPAAKKPATKRTIKAAGAVENPY